jgi:S1-C subfamily serine protease
LKAFEQLTVPEELTISLFQRAAPSVAYVSTFSSKFDPFASPGGAVVQQPRGTGSGIVWDTLGHVVTNFHVIQDADDVQITLTEGRRKDGRPGAQRLYPATLTGFDVDKDVAVLKVNVGALDSRLAPLKIGTSADLRVGQSVLAIGNPFGLDHTLTTGIVSGLGREVRAPSGRPILDVVQTDASINPGNSGGPLLDSRGQLVGLNTAIYSTPAGASTGVRGSLQTKHYLLYQRVSRYMRNKALPFQVGFAIPVDTLKFVVASIIRDGKVVRPAMGVSYLPSALAQRIGVSR